MANKRRIFEGTGRFRPFADSIGIEADSAGHFHRKWHYPGKLTGDASMPNREPIRASEIGDWCFCRRAWYLTNRKTRPSLLQIERRQAGTAYHERQGRATVQPRREINAEKLVLLLLLLFFVACWLSLRSC